MLGESFAHAPENTPLPQGLCSALVAGAAFVARSWILWDEEGPPQLGDELAEWVLGCRRAYLEERKVPVSPSHSRISGGDESRPLRSSRDLIILATAKLAASGEADALALPRILKKAGVSGLTFESQFDGIEGCLIATADSLADQTFGDAVQIKQLAGSWEEGIHLATHTLCERVQRDPAIGRLWFTEIPGLGPEGMYCCERLIAEIGDLISYGSPISSPDDVAIEASAGAIWEVLRQLAVSHRPLEKAQATKLLTSLTAAPHIP